SVLHNLAHMALRRGDPARAATRFAESLAAFRERGDQRGIADCLMGVARVASEVGEPERAARLLGAGEALLEAIGAAVFPSNRGDHGRRGAAMRAALGEEAFGAARAAGRSLPPEEAIAEARGVAAGVALPR